MAVEDLILGVTEADGPARLSAFVRLHKIGALGLGSGYVLAGTPLSRRSSGKYEPWGYGHKLVGFAMELVLLDATEDTLCPIMLRGEILYGDVALPAGQNQSDLDVELRAMRERGLEVAGLTDADQVDIDSTLNALVPNFISAGSVVYNPVITQV